jgi:hypothetical protein
MASIQQRELSIIAEINTKFTCNQLAQQHGHSTDSSRVSKHKSIKDISGISNQKRCFSEGFCIKYILLDLRVE